MHGIGIVGKLMCGACLQWGGGGGGITIMVICLEHVVQKTVQNRILVSVVITFLLPYIYK